MEPHVHVVLDNNESVRPCGPGMDSDLTSAVAKLEAHFAQSLITIKPRRRASAGGFDESTATTKSSEYETLSNLETAVYKCPRDQLLALQPQLEQLLLKRCLPMSGALALRQVLAQCLVGVFRNGNKATLSQVYYELQTACLKTSKNYDVQLVSMHCLGSLVEAFPRELGSGKYFLDSIECFSKQVRAVELCIRETSFMSLIKIVRVAAKNSVFVKAEQLEELKKLLVKTASDKCNSIRKFIAELLPHLYRLTSEAADLDFFIDAAFKGLTDAQNPVREAYAISLGRILAAAISHVLPPKPANIFKNLKNVKPNYEVKDIRGGFEILQVFFGKNSRREIQLDGRPAYTSSAAVQADWKEKSKLAIGAALTVATIEFISQVGPLNIVYPPAAVQEVQPEASSGLASAFPFQLSKKPAPSGPPVLRHSASLITVITLMREHLEEKENAADKNLKEEKLARLISHLISTALVNAIPHASQEALAEQLIQIVFSKESNLSVAQVTACLWQIAHLVKILGLDSVRSLESKINARTLEPLLCSTDSLIRSGAIDILRHFAIAIPFSASKILQDLHSSASIFIPQATATEIDGPDKIKVLSSFHGHIHAIAAVIRVIPRLSNGVPWEFLGDLFATSKVLLGAFNECRKEVKSGSPLEAAKTICEAGWVLLDSLINIGIDWVGPKLRQLFVIWKEVLGAKLQPAQHNDPQELTVELHSRTMALSCLLSFIELFSERVCAEPVMLKPILSFLGNGVGFIHVLKKSDTWQNIVAANPSFSVQLMHFESVLLDCYSYLPPLSYQSRFVPLLHIAVAQLTAKHCWRNTLLENLLDQQLHEQALLNPFTFAISVRERCEAPVLDDDSDRPRLRLFGQVTWKFLLKWKNDEMFELPGEVKVINSAVRFFAHVFPFQSSHHQHQLTEHFFTLTQQIISKGKRFSNALCNIGVALFLSMENMTSSNAKFGSIADVTGGDDAENSEMTVKAILEVGMDLLRSDEVLLRHCGGEILGFLGKSQGDAFTKQLIQRCRKEFQESNVVSLSGYCIVLASIHKRIGAIASHKYVGFTISTLEALSDSDSDQLRPWIMYCLWSVMRVSGLSFSSHFEKAVKMLLKQVVMDIEIESRFNHPLIDLLYARLTVSILESFGPELFEDPVRLNQVLAVWNHIRTGTGVFDISIHVRAQTIESIEQLITWNSNNRLDLPVLAEIFLQEIGMLSKSNDILISWIKALRQWSQKHPAFILEQNLDIVLFKFLDSIPMSYEVPAVKKEILLTLDSFVENLGKTHPTRFFYLAEDIVVRLKLPQPRDPSETRHELRESTGLDQEEFEDDRERSPSPEDPEDIHKVAVEETVRPHTKTVALYALIKVFNILKDDPNNQHLRFPEKAVARDLLILHLRDVIKMMCRACNSSDPELMIKGVQGLEAVFECFHKLDDQSEKGMKYLQLFQAEIVSAMRSLFSADCAPSVRVVGCKILPRLIKSGLITDEALLRRLIFSLTKPLDTDQELVKGWQKSYDSSTISRLLLAHLSSLSRILSPYFGKNKEFLADDNLEAEMPPVIVKQILSEHFDLIREKILDVAEDFAIICTTSPRLLRKYKGKFFEGAEVITVAPVFTNQIGYFLRTATLLLEQYVSDKLKSGAEGSIDTKRLFKNKMTLVALAVHYVDVYFEKGSKIEADPKRAPLPSPKIVARWSLQCLVYLLSQVIHMISAQDQRKLTEDILNVLLKGVEHSRLDSFFQKSLVQTISSLIQVMTKVDNDWPAYFYSKLSALLVFVLNVQSANEKLENEVIAETVVAFYRLCEQLLKGENSENEIYGSSKNLIALLLNALRKSALSSLNSRFSEACLAGVAKICSLSSSLADVSKAVLVSLLEDLSDANYVNKSKGLIDTSCKLAFVIGSHPALQKRVADQMNRSLLQKSSIEARLGALSGYSVIVQAIPSKSSEEQLTLKSYLGHLSSSLIFASVNPLGASDAEEGAKCLFSLYAVLSDDSEKQVMEGILLYCLLRNLPQSVTDESLYSTSLAELSVQGILKLTQIMGDRFKPIFSSFDLDLQSRFEFSLRAITAANERKKKLESAQAEEDEKKKKSDKKTRKFR